MIPDSFIQDLLARVDIVDVIERFVPLKKSGANYQACCPFHAEKTPSFTVSQSKQFYHCFGCGAHGSAIGFLMQYAGLGFIESIEDLAHSVGLVVPKQEEAKRQNEKHRTAPLTELLAQAARHFKSKLKTSPLAIDYLKQRGLTGEIAALYGLGYATDDWQGLSEIFSDYKLPALVECGLVIENEQGRRYDRFRDRIMFPIIDAKGQVIGFGGRVLGKGEPKYLNSPETPVFEKGRELYGLPQARQAIRADDCVIVVEGYMDVVALAQFGVRNAVATLGTATTVSHVQKLLRLASRVVFCFDGDQAGRKAAWRALENSLECLSDDKSVGFLFLPVEHDPDSFVRAEGAAAFQRLVRQPTTLTEFLLRQLKPDIDLGTAEGRAHLVHAAKPFLQKLAAPILRVQITKQIADAAGLTQQEIEAQSDISPLTRTRFAPPRRSHSVEISQLKSILKAVLRRPERSARLPLELIDQESPEGAALHAIADAMEHGELATVNIGQIVEFFRSTPHNRIIGQMVTDTVQEVVDEGAEEQEFVDSLNRLKDAQLKIEIDILNSRAKLGSLTTEEQQHLGALLMAKTKLGKKDE